MPRSSNETSGARCGSPSVSRASLGLPITAPRVCSRPRPICGGFASTDGFSIGDLSTGGFSTGGFSTGGVSTGGVSTGSDAVRQRGALGFSSGGIWTGGTRTLPLAAVQMVDTAGADGDDCPSLARIEEQRFSPHPTTHSVRRWKLCDCFVRGQFLVSLFTEKSGRARTAH